MGIVLVIVAGLLALLSMLVDRYSFRLLAVAVILLAIALVVGVHSVDLNQQALMR